MSDELLSPLLGSSLRVENKTQLDEFLTRPDAQEVLQSASFEEVFFAVKHIGLADSMDLLPLVTSRQVRGFIDLDCWRKDTFVRKPFMEWIAAFIQSGPEETVRALSGVDEYVISLFLKDVMRVYEVERDDPPSEIQLIYTPDNRFAVELLEEDEATTVGMLILDALFKYNPKLGSSLLTQVRYTTRIELEETAFENKTSRLELHGFVDYYDALSIYAGSGAQRGDAAIREPVVEDIPGEEAPGSLPAVFAESLSGAAFLQQSFAYVTDPDEVERLAHQLTALGNRVLSANLVNLGELESIRPALEEMRDVLAIGLEHLTGRRPERASDILKASYAQTIFKTGFDQIARLRDKADSLAFIPRFKLSMLDTDDQEFAEALRRFKPLLIDQGRYRNFRTLADVEAAHQRLQAIDGMTRVFMQKWPSVHDTFEKTFNTALVQFALTGKFESEPLTAEDVEHYLEDGFRLPDVTLPEELRPFADRWTGRLQEELTPLIGKKIDPRFIGMVKVKL